jgi:hypothetical protein
MTAVGQSRRLGHVRGPSAYSSTAAVRLAVDLSPGAGLVPARLCAYAVRRATTTRAFTPVFDGLWVAGCECRARTCANRAVRPRRDPVALYCPPIRCENAVASPG